MERHWPTLPNAFVANPAALSRAHYEGGFREGARHGEGVYTWPNGNRFEGEWRDGKLHGQGVLTVNHETRVEGEWRDGEFIRE